MKRRWCGARELALAVLCATLTPGTLLHSQTRSRGAACTAAESRGYAEPVASVIAAERAFARMSLDSGTHAAFLANLHDDGILFRPGPVAGRTWLAAHPPQGEQGVLFWGPVWAGASRAGDLGFTRGPYEFEGVQRGDTVAAYGTYATVWGRRPGEPWKVLVDLGTRNAPRVEPAACGPVARARVGESDDVTTPVPGVGEAEGVRASALADALRADSLLGAHYGEDGRRGLAALADDQTRVLRNGRAPMVGTRAIRDYVRTLGTRFRSRPTGGAAAASGDLAYTYGTYQMASAAAARADSGNYVRVWRRTAAGWRPLLDVTSPYPPGTP